MLHQPHKLDQPKLESIESLQVIRAIAAMLVLLVHISELMKSRLDYSSAFQIFHFGWSGVDIFFVLSGFIIYYTSAKKITTLTAREFILRRLIRIYPIYWVALIFTVGICLVGKYLNPAASNNYVLIKLIESGDLNIILSAIFLIPNENPLVRTAWTLSYEMLFYLSFGLLFFYKQRLFMIFMSTWIMVCVMQKIGIVYLDLNPSWMIRKLLNPLIIEFFFGCIIAIIVLKYTPKYPIIVLLLGIVLFTAAAVISCFSVWRTFFFGIPSALIIYGSVYLRLNFYKFLIFLGDASYTIYLFHLLFSYVIIQALYSLHLAHYASNAFGFIVISILTLLVCCGTHAYIENPMLNFLKMKIKFPKNMKISISPQEA